MDTKTIKFDSSQRHPPEVRQRTNRNKKKQSKSSKKDPPNKISNFFSKGWNIVRFFFFLAVIIFLLSVLLSTFSSIPEGESFTWTLFFKQLRGTLSAIGYSSPMINPIFKEISKTITEGNFNFLFFLSSLFFTISLLVCFCP